MNKKKIRRIQLLLLTVAFIFVLCPFAILADSDQMLLSVNDASEIRVVASDIPTASLTPAPIQAVVFTNGNVPVNSSEITLIIESGETELLDQIQGLSVCHLEGSTCYDEILAYAASHPDIKVTYDVQVFGSAYANDTDLIRVSGNRCGANDILTAFRCLPSLSAIDLNGSKLSVSDCELISDLFENAVINYKISFGSVTIDSSAEKIDLNQYTFIDVDSLISAISYLPNLKYIDLSQAKGIDLETVGRIQKARSGLIVDFPVTIYGKTFSTADKYIVLSKKRIKTKQLDELRSIMPFMTNCEKVIMEDCGLSDQVMDELRTELEPYAEVVWRIKCGPYSCRTDAIMIKFSGKSSILNDSKAKSLYYLHDIRYLDLGHNHLQHIDFVAGMPDLEVCIIAINYLVDISPIQYCTKLEYCEFLSNISIDVTPLAACKELRHLNISYSGVSDITPLYGLTKLERLWISRNHIPDDQIEKIKELLPDAIINTTAHNCTGEGWREHPRYDLLREQFRYDNSRIRSYYIMDGEIIEDTTR